MVECADRQRQDGATVTVYDNGDLVIWRSDLSYHLRADGKRAWVTKRSIMFVDRPGHRHWEPREPI